MGVIYIFSHYQLVQEIQSSVHGKNARINRHKKCFKLFETFYIMYPEQLKSLYDTLLSAHDILYFNYYNLYHAHTKQNVNTHSIS